MWTISSGLPKRPVGLRARRMRLASSSLTSQSMSSGVSIGPGQMAFVRMPFGANWTARLRVSAQHGALRRRVGILGHGAAEDGDEARDVDDRARARRPSMAGIAYLQPRKTPRTLTAMTWSHDVDVGVVDQWSASGMTPALL